MSNLCIKKLQKQQSSNFFIISSNKCRAENKHLVLKLHSFVKVILKHKRLQVLVRLSEADVNKHFQHRNELRTGSIVWKSPKLVLGA